MGSIYRPKYTDRHGQERESSVWWIKYYSRGQMIREGTETTEHDKAKEFLKKREGEAVEKGPINTTSRRITFAELAQDETNDYKMNDRDTIKDLKTRLDLHILPFFGKSRAINIKPTDITTYAVGRQADGASNGTINRELTAIGLPDRIPHDFRRTAVRNLVRAGAGNCRNEDDRT